MRRLRATPCPLRRAAVLVGVVEPEIEKAPTDDSPDGLLALSLALVVGDTTEAVSFVPPLLCLAILCCVVGDLAEYPSEASCFNEAVADGVGVGIGIGRVPILRRAAEPSSLRRATESAELSDSKTEKAPNDDLLESPLVSLVGGMTEESTNDRPAEVLACLVGGTADAISSIPPPLRLATDRFKSEMAGALIEVPLEESLINAAVTGGGGAAALPVGFPLDA
jgi:hypothetical protein